jgi:hypothetical protein
MNDEASGASSAFSFAGQFLVMLWMCVVLCIVGLLGFTWIRQAGVAGGITFLVVSISFVLLIGFLLLAGRSDVLVDDQGISRRLFGWTWQTIQWGNVRLITAFPVFGGSGYTPRAFNIYPSVRPKVRVMPSGKMSFTDKMSDAPRLIKLLNQYASSHGIKIEVRDSLAGNLRAARRL